MVVDDPTYPQGYFRVEYVTVLIPRYTMTHLNHVSRSGRLLPRDLHSNAICLN